MLKIVDKYSVSNMLYSPFHRNEDMVSYAGITKQAVSLISPSSSMANYCLRVCAILDISIIYIELLTHPDDHKHHLSSYHFSLFGSIINSAKSHSTGGNFILWYSSIICSCFSSSNLSSSVLFNPNMMLI